MCDRMKNIAQNFLTLKKEVVKQLLGELNTHDMHTTGKKR